MYRTPMPQPNPDSTLPYLLILTLTLTLTLTRQVGLYQHNQMTGPDNGKNAWVTSDWWNTHHQNAWVESGEWPPPNTGAGIWITNASSPLAANYPAGSVWGVRRKGLEPSPVYPQALTYYSLR